MPTSELTRRALLIGLLATGALAAMGRLAHAISPGNAQTFVAGLAGELMALVNSGRSEAQIYDGFERLLARHADMPAVAASVLGPPWRGASAAQRQAFVGAFQHYLARRYGRQFRDYRNARIEVRGARDGGKAGVLVQTVVIRPGQANIAVDWQVSDRSGATKVVNLIIEGVSMLANERAEIGAQLEAKRGNLDALTAQLRATS